MEESLSVAAPTKGRMKNAEYKMQTANKQKAH
jgi:hypothetical protein